MHASELWNSKAVGPRVARLALTPLSWLYALGWEAYLGTYALGLKKAAEPHARVMCIGNLQSGGSGKSPLTRHIVHLLRSLDIPVVVACSGYGSPRSEAATLAPEGPLDAAEWGDEPAMLRWLEPDLPLIVGRRRVLAAELAAQHYPQAVMLMDDGFQHLPLKKHLTILLDPKRPANRQCLPAGPYREPRFNRRRADLVLPNEHFDIVSEPTTLMTPDGETQVPKRYSLLCALGKPELFLAAVEQALGYGPEMSACLTDHDRLDAGTLLDDFPADVPIVVTAKDWVKLRNRKDVASRMFLIARHEVRVEPATEFADWLKTKLHA